ncbi:MULTISPECIES: MaoC family dehydratase [Burkholderia]|uniref:Dehydratase n=1 Tax=Burkholderia gladioli TaxID=28095 RepID=A0A2A7S9E8_BURGA|nr:MULTISPECIES: MaoC family dehydratase [Burkholderia]ATF87258.1 dehydratase [Burkholderia gladioli pv. gladioli]MBJ9664991.1 MaoC family dehydratase [Burkholderia gladioli]MBJ9709681.1 MaoC family dehydratase [Burkholderia gladioli]MBU9155948.1 MaoC family dehydratase [Burkholderia gladioli]MBU9170456.1 MaoC family dehydratase [Burkholderia gladioli]
MTIGYEDLEVGGLTEVGKHTFTPDEIIEFAQRFDPQPFHLDEAAGKASPFGGLVASGWHTCSVFMGMLVRNVLHDSTSMGSPGIEEIRWIKPVRAGATITMQQRILDKRLSASRPDRGIVTTEWVGTDESGETVITVRSKVIFGLRNPQVGA